MSCLTTSATLVAGIYVMHLEIKAIKWMWNDTIDDIRWWRENGKIIDGRYLTNSELRQQD